MGRPFFVPRAYTRRQSYPFTTTSDAATSSTSTQIIRMPGLQFDNLVGVAVLAFRTDKGLRNGAAIDTVRLKAKPVQQPGLFGGDVWHPFAAIDSNQQTAILWEGAFLMPGEGCDFELMVGTNARAVDLIVDRVLLFAD